MTFSEQGGAVSDPLYLNKKEVLQDHSRLTYMTLQKGSVANVIKLLTVVSYTFS
jgi:hypothetical protein